MLILTSLTYKNQVKSIIFFTCPPFFEPQSPLHIDGEKIKLGSGLASEALAIASRVEAELNKIINAFNLHTHASHGAVSLPAIASASLIATTKVVAE